VGSVCGLKPGGIGTERRELIATEAEALTGSSGRVTRKGALPSPVGVTSENAVEVSVEGLRRLRFASVAFGAAVSGQGRERTVGLIFICGLATRAVLFPIVAYELLRILPHMTAVMSLAELFGLRVGHGVSLPSMRRARISSFAELVSQYHCPAGFFSNANGKEQLSAPTLRTRSGPGATDFNFALAMDLCFSHFAANRGGAFSRSPYDVPTDRIHHESTATRV
jgi:hypothetical protein